MIFRMKKAFFAACLPLLLVACGPVGPVETPVVPATESGTVASVNLNKGGVTYTEYSDRVIGRGKSSVLFFFRPTDPFSVRNDAVIRAVYGTGAAVVSTYRVDYPTSTGARLKYGVLIEDTFVLLDAQGQRVASFIHPTDEEIRIILRGNIPVPAKP